MIKCPKHPKYKGIRIPKHKSKPLAESLCSCMAIYLAKKEGVDLKWITMPDGTKHLVEY